MKKINTLLLSITLATSSLFATNTTMANEPYLGEIAYFAGNFAPRGWAFCDGQILPINQYQSLYSLLGTTYGGDGRTTFALPDMRGRALVHAGSGPGLSPRPQGQRFGNETETITVAQMPSHNHTIHSTSDSTVNDTANGKALGAVKMYKSRTTPSNELNSETLGHTGASQAVNTVQPTLAINCIIAIQGLFPPRN